MIAVTVALLGTSGWLLWENDQLKQQKAILEQNIENLQGNVSTLETNLSEEEQAKRQLNQELDNEKQRQQALLKSHQAEMEEFKKFVEVEKEEMSTLHTKLVEELQNEITSREIKLQEMNDGRISLSMENKILFPSGTANLGERGSEVLSKISSALENTDDHIIRVEGHTDNVPLSGKGLYKSNWELSAARALSVVRELLKGKELKPVNIEAVAMGEFHPVADNNTKEGKAQNRRIEIYLTPKPKNQSLIESIDSEPNID